MTQYTSATSNGDSSLFKSLSSLLQTSHQVSKLCHNAFLKECNNEVLEMEEEKIHGTVGNPLLHLVL